ncbi:uncharacterized protein LOC142329169 isoform X11 [Lycorma delicatula]|uniref:uncharacterized protein LOC142329169 isoform X11 n=1 Tax=Lycorma delicatula TaxID=130591 RepID=UPI003F50F835
MNWNLLVNTSRTAIRTGTVRKNKKPRVTKIWCKKLEFETAEEAENHVKALKLWKKCTAYKCLAGLKVAYRCTAAQYRQIECPARLYLLYHAEDMKVSLFETTSEHCNHIDGTRGLPLKTREFVRQIFNTGIKKPNAIIDAFRCRNLTVPDKMKLKNFLTSLRKKKSTTENTEGNITGDLNKNEGDDENSILPMEVNLDDETEEPRDAQFNDTELDAEDPLNIDNTPTSTTVIETVPTPKIISTATVVNDDKPNEQKATGQNIHVRQNLTENPAPLPVVPVNPVRKRMQLKRPLPVSDILDGYNAKVSIEDEYKNYIDEDKAFLMSLLPAMKELTGPQKMEFKMTVLNELKRIRYPSSTPTPQTVGNLTVLPYAFQPIPNLANISHVIPIQQRTINPTTLQQVINKNSSTTQQTCKILSSQPPPLAAIIPQTVSATSAETAKQKQSPTVSSTATTAATVTAKPTPVEPPAKRASVSKDNNARSQPSATETKKTTSRRTPARRKPKKQAATNETQNNTEETQIITSDLTTPQDEEETRNDGELRTEIDLDEIKIEHIKVEPYDDEDTEDAMENC